MRNLDPHARNLILAVNEIAFEALEWHHQAYLDGGGDGYFYDEQTRRELAALEPQLAVGIDRLRMFLLNENEDIRQGRVAITAAEDAAFFAERLAHNGELLVKLAGYNAARMCAPRGE